jgi:hypothetical protein
VHALGGTLFVFLLLGAPRPASAASPVLTGIEPRGAQRGKTFTLTLQGERLVPGAEFLSPLPGTISRLAPPKDLENPETRLPFLVQVPPDAPVGLYPVRVRTADGLSNILLFSVGDLPEMVEKEPNDTAAQANLITLPGTITGTLQGPDRDYFKFVSRASERWVFEVEARRAGSAIDPVIEILDAKGQRVAFNDDAPNLSADARLEVTLPLAGTYFVLVHDSKYSDQSENFYRLKIGRYAYAEGIFPLGGQRGKSVEVELFGGNLPRLVKVRADLSVAPGVDSVPVNLPGPRSVGSLPFQLRVGDFPETLEPTEGQEKELPPSTIINGRISAPGEVDRYKVKVAPGQKWLFEIEAASLGTSRMYAALDVRDAAGKRLKSKEIRIGPDPRLVFEVPEKVEEVVLTVEDLRGQGGPAYAYRLRGEPQDEDFALRQITPYVNIPAGGTAAIEVVAERFGYSGTVKLSIPDLPEGLTASGGTLHAVEVDHTNMRPLTTRGYITLSAKAGTAPRAWNLTVWGEGMTARGPIRRRARAPGLMVAVKGGDILSLTGDFLPRKPLIYPWLNTGLPAAVTKPSPAILQLDTQTLRVAQGIDAPVGYKLIANGPGIVFKDISAALPYGELKDLAVTQPEESKKKEPGKVFVKSSFDTPAAELDLLLTASVQIDGRDELVAAPAVPMQVVPGYRVALASAHMEIMPGGKAELGGTIGRESVFTGPVKVQIADPPEKVTCPAVEVPPDKSDFVLVCEASPEAQKGDFDIHVAPVGLVPGRQDQREYRIPPITARMVVKGEGSAVAAAEGIR